MTSTAAPATDPDYLIALNRRASRRARIVWEGDTPFGARAVRRFRLGNGLRVLLLEDHAAPVVSYHTWFRVGSRHELEGKTGLAHLFEHLMFNETRSLPAGRFDRLLERAGAETNAATWTDWTYYYENIPSDQLPLVVRLEAERMVHLVLRQGPVASEKEVVANERRYRVDDDVEGTLNEVLWANAFDVHPYHHPTIGWMKDIQGFTVGDCRAFYKTYYAPNNATLVVAGDVVPRDVLALIQQHYGPLRPARIPPEDTPEEPDPVAERWVVLRRPTPTDKVAIGYRAPGLAHPDHAPLSVLAEALTGGRSSRLFRRLVTERELASEISSWVSTFRDPGLWEIAATTREGVSSETLVTAIDGLLDELQTSPITEEERTRAVARMELGFLRGLESVAGRADQIGFFDTVLQDPAGGFARLEALRATRAAQVQSAATRYLVRARRTLVVVKSDLAGAVPA